MAMNVTVNFGQADDRGSWEIALFVQPSDTIADLKQAIQKCKGIPVETQVLQFNSRVFENEYPLRSFNFNDKSFFELHCRLNILAIVHDRQEIVIETDNYETIASLKSKIAEVLKKPADRLAIFKDAGVTYELSQRRPVVRLLALRDFYFVKGRQVFVKVFEGPDYFNISAETFTGKVIQLIVAGSDSVELTKERLLLSLKILNPDFSKFINLTYKNALMDDKKRLSEYGVQNGAVLKIFLAYSHVMSFNFLNSLDEFVTLSGITLFNTVGEIKRKAASLLGVSVDSLQLKSHRRNKFLNNEARTLFECGITSPERELHVVDGRNMICVKNDLLGTIHVDLFEKDSNSTIGELKAKISAVTRVMPGDQSLSFRGVNIDSDDEETVASVGVKMMSTLQLSLLRRRRRPLVAVKVTVSRHVGKLSLLSSDPVECLTEEMGQQCSIDLSNYSCLYETMMPIAKSIPFGTDPINVFHFESPAAEFSKMSHPGPLAAKVVSSTSNAPDAAPPLQLPAVEMSLPQFAMIGSASCSLWKMISWTLYGNPTSAVAAPKAWKYFSLQIFVKTLTGKTLSLRCGPHDTVDLIKERLFEIEGIPPDYQRLTFGRQQLEDDRTLSDYKVTDESTIQLTLRLYGC